MTDDTQPAAGRPAIVGRRVRIVGSHPHRGEEGVVEKTSGPAGMWLIKLDHCDHGVEGCFANPEKLREVSVKLSKVQR